MLVGSVAEARQAIEAGVLTLHASVKGRHTSIDAEGKEITLVYDTTPGRMILGEVLPKVAGVKFMTVGNRLDG